MLSFHVSEACPPAMILFYSNKLKLKNGPETDYNLVNFKDNLCIDHTRILMANL